MCDDKKKKNDSIIRRREILQLSTGCGYKWIHCQSYGIIYEGLYLGLVHLASKLFSVVAL